MHEQTLVKALLRQVIEFCYNHGAEHVTEVRVEMGPLSGVEASLVAAAFERMVPEGIAANAKLVIDEVALLAECLSCGHEYEVKDFVFRCPTCGGNVRVIRGEEFQLVSVSMQGDNLTQELVS